MLLISWHWKSGETIKGDKHNQHNDFHVIITWGAFIRTERCSYLHFVDKRFVNGPAESAQQFGCGGFGSEQRQSFFLLFFNFSYCWTFGLHQFPTEVQRFVYYSSIYYYHVETSYLRDYMCT